MIIEAVFTFYCFNKGIKLSYQIRILNANNEQVVSYILLLNPVWCCSNNFIIVCLSSDKTCSLLYSEYIVGLNSLLSMLLARLGCLTWSLSWLLLLRGSLAAPVFCCSGVAPRSRLPLLRCDVEIRGRVTRVASTRRGAGATTSSASSCMRQNV